jgi:VWFA-related protein
LYTALYVALNQFQRLAAKSPDVRRPAIVVLTDGQDTASLVEFDTVLERARRAGVAIYPISVMSAYEGRAVVEDGGRRHSTEADYALKTLAKETGGRAYFPLALAELDGVYQAVASELSTQYALGYAPRGPRDDGAFHRITVNVTSRPDARLRTRAGYYAPRAAASLSRPSSQNR